MGQTTPKPGGTFRFLGVPADDQRLPFGAGQDAVPVGTVVTVRELVPADVAGAHTDGEDAVVVEWAQPEVGHDDGEPVIRYRQRATSFGAAQFSDLFTKEA